MNKIIKPFGKISEFEEEFIKAATNEDRLIAVIKTAANDGKTDGHLFNQGLETLKIYLLGNKDAIVEFNNTLMQLRSDYLIQTEKTNTISSWNRINNAISGTVKILEQQS